MTTTPATDLTWDPFTRAIWENPYPIYQRMRAEAPAYYNAEHNFWAFSRWEDIDRCLPDVARFSSARGNILEFIQAGIEMPPGTVIMEDPPSHDINRALISRLFTPKAVADLEPSIRDYTRRQLDTVTDQESWDIITTLSDTVPIRVIGMLVGIPEEMQAEFRAQTVNQLRTEGDGRMDPAQTMIDTSLMEKYLDWRIENPSDDIITRLLTAEFEDAQGVTRRLTRDEVMLYCTVVSGAGNDTTGHLIGWMAKIFGEEQHREAYQRLVADPSLIPNAVEEILRLEPVGHAVARYLTQDTELHGQVVPAGSACVFILASANRDERVWGDDADVLDLDRQAKSNQRSFGIGRHYCLGANLARLEARVVLEELVERYPRGWDADTTHAELVSTTTVRGWEAMTITPRR